MRKLMEKLWPESHIKLLFNWIYSWNYYNKLFGKIRTCYLLHLCSSWTYGPLGSIWNMRWESPILLLKLTWNALWMILYSYASLLAMISYLICLLSRFVRFLCWSNYSIVGLYFYIVILTVTLGLLYEAKVLIESLPLCNLLISGCNQLVNGSIQEGI